MRITLATNTFKANKENLKEIILNDAEVQETISGTMESSYAKIYYDSASDSNRLTSELNNTYDNVNTYDTYDALIAKEPSGRSDVLYIVTNGGDASVSPTTYIWVNSAYEETTAVMGVDNISTEDITKLFSKAPDTLNSATGN